MTRARGARGARGVQAIRPGALALCANRRVGHTWNDPANQHWERAEPIRVGRRTLARIRCVSTCDRCQSQRVEPFFVDARSHLTERDTLWYRHSDPYKKRERLDNSESDWQRIPANIIRQIAS